MLPCKYLTYKEWKPLMTNLSNNHLVPTACKYLTYKEWKLFAQAITPTSNMTSKYLTYKEWKQSGRLIAKFLPFTCSVM